MSSSNSISQSFGLMDLWFQYLLLGTSAVSDILYPVHSQTSLNCFQYLLLATSVVSGILPCTLTDHNFKTGPGHLQQLDTSYRLSPMASSKPLLHYILTDSGFILTVGLFQHNKYIHSINS